MTEFLNFLDQMRFYCSQILVLQFTSWITLLPFAWFTLEQLYKLLKRIK